MSLPSRQITITTANTHWGRMIHTTDGLKPIENTDILLLQEVIGLQDGMKEQLKKAGFKLVHAAEHFGLAIALRLSSDFLLDPHSLKTFSLQKMSPIEHRLTQKGAGRAHAFTEHGMIAARFATKDGFAITVANVHLSVPIKPRARALQIKKMGHELNNTYYSGRLVVGGDMNHYRGPASIDKAMYTKSNLKSVNLAGEPTWYARGSKQEKYLKVNAFIRRRPLEYYNGHHDAVLYRGTGLHAAATRVVDIHSDHRAIIAVFELSPA